MKTKGRNYSTPSYREKLRYMSVLDKNGMNKSQTARQLGLSRNTIIRYYNECWEEYLKSREKINDDSLDIEVRKLKKVEQLEKVTQITFDLFYSAINSIQKMLENPERIKTKDLILIISTLAPYVVEKRSTAGVREENEQTGLTHTAFVQNFINQMNCSNPKNSSNEKSN